MNCDAVEPVSHGYVAVPCSDDLPTAIRKILDYSWCSEHSDYHDHADEPSHILHTLSALAHWLDRQTASPPEQLPRRLHGSLSGDLHSTITDQILAELSELSGLFLACIWERYNDRVGFHGPCRVYVQSHWQLYELDDTLWSWLASHEPPDHCDASVWIGGPVLPLDLDDLFGSRHNYAALTEHRQ